MRKWRDRHAAEGAAGLRDRSAAAVHRQPARLVAEVVAAIEQLRRQR